MLSPKLGTLQPTWSAIQARAASGPLPPGGLSIAFTPASELSRLGPDLADLAGRSLQPNAFLEPAFLQPATVGLGGRRVELATAWDGHRLLGALPILREPFRHGVPLGLVHAWTHPYGVLSTPLLDRSRADAAWRALLSGLARNGARALLMRYLPATGPTAELIREVAAELSLPWAAIEPHGRAVLSTTLDGETYLSQSLSSKKRKEYRRQRRRLDEELGGAAFLLHRTPREVERVTAEFLALEAAGWKGARGTALVHRPAERAFFEAALGGLAVEGKVLAASLRAGSKPIAAGLVLLSGGGAFFWKTAYDESLARFSPGVLLTIELTAALIAEGHGGQTDSCAVADHPMIDHVWRERAEIHDLVLGLDPGRFQPRFRTIVAAETARRAVRIRAKSLVVNLRKRIGT